MVSFVRWAISQLDLDFELHEGHGLLQLAEADQPHFDGQSELKLSLGENASDNSLEPIHLDGRFCQWLLDRLNNVESYLSVKPLEQPSAVNDITQKLFDAYQVDDGRVHLGGCQLTDFSFVRLSFAGADNGEQEIRHIFVAHDGSAVSDQLAADLGLMEIEPILQRPPRIEESALQSLLSAGRRVAAQTVTSRDPGAATVEPLVTAIVWVKQASGHLDFTIGETTVSQPFSGWAKLLKPQPYTSPQSGAASFHLAATDDGFIDVFDQIAVCEESGRRVLRQELVTCSATGKQVLEEFTETCSVTGAQCLSDQFTICSSCQQRVSKLALEGNTCKACRSLKKIKKDDPRLVWILGEHGGLDSWNNWQLAETKTVYIAQAAGWTKRLRLVVDKESLAVHHLATSTRLSSLWTPVDEAVRDELLN